MIPPDNGPPRALAALLSEPLSTLFERADVPFELPEALSAAYGGGGFGLPTDCVYANFVESLDGVVALPGATESGQVISGRNPADRFVMGLLRACADAVLVGAGTFRRAGAHLWHAERIFPAATSLFREARVRLGLSVAPTLVLISASGDLDVSQPAVPGAWIMTTERGAAALRGKLPQGARLSVFDSPRLEPAFVLAELRREGFRRVLTEGGPTLFAQMLEARLVDQLFLTSAPALFGRYAGDQRAGLAEGVNLAGTALELLSARRHGSHLFLRYALPR